MNKLVRSNRKGGVNVIVIASPDHASQIRPSEVLQVDIDIIWVFKVNIMASEGR